jgi:hypothetical protein
MTGSYRFYRETITLAGHRYAKIFLAEGLAEALFLNTLFTRKNFDENEYCVFCIKGISNLGTSLKYLCSETEFDQVKSLGIMIDADDNPKGRMDSVLNHLNNHDLSDENFDLKENTVFEYNERQIGIFISPGEGKKGRIETIIVEELSTKKEYECISEYINCLSERCHNTLDEKAIVQIYISSKKSDLCGTGRGFEAMILDIDHKTYELAVTTFTSI